MNIEKEVWGVSENGLEKVKCFSKRIKLKHGMFANIPILCKKDKCPYSNICSIDVEDREIGSRCPMEIGAIISRFNSWCKHFGIDDSKDYIDDKDLVDATLIRDLIDLEIQVLRAENRIALNADFIAKTIASVDNKGNVFYEDAVTPESEYKLNLLDKRYKVLQLLNSTRKDKSKDLKVQLNPSQEAISIFNKISQKLGDINLEEEGD